MRKSTTDLLCGLSFLGISALFGSQMMGLKGVTRVFPQALLVVIAIGGLWFTGKGLYRRHMESKPECDHEPVAWKKVGLIAAMSLLYALIVNVLGFFTSSSLFILFTSLLMGDKSRGMGHLVKISATFTVVFCVLLWVSFVKLLSVPTPTGMFF